MKLAKLNDSPDRKSVYIMQFNLVTFIFINPLGREVGPSCATICIVAVCRIKQAGEFSFYCDDHHTILRLFIH